MFFKSLHQTSSIFQEDHAIAKKAVSEPSSKEKGKSIATAKRWNSLLGALASTASGVVGEGAGGADSLAALADVVADVVVTATDLAGNGSLVLGATNALEVAGLGSLAGGGVDVTALGERDLAVVAGALATDLYFGAGELLLDGLVDTGLKGWKEIVSVWILEEVGNEGNILESEAPAGPREVSSTRWDCLAPWELRSRSACLAMAMGS